MSVIGHFVELAGIATTGISLIKEHSVGFRPPRALWVPFPLGRPFGAPNNPVLQIEILESLLSLLESDAGPAVLSEFPKDAPCREPGKPLGTFKPADWVHASSDVGNTVASVKTELEFLSPRHSSWVGKAGNRTITGASGLTPPEMVDFLSAVVSDGNPALPPNAAARSIAAMVRLSGEEIRHWYVEAAMDSPMQDLSINAIDKWFWGETVCASLLLEVQAALAGSDQEDIAKVAASGLIPRAQHHRLLANRRS